MHSRHGSSAIEDHRGDQAQWSSDGGPFSRLHGWLRPNEAPGWGIDLDEAAAAKYPAELSGHDAWAAGVRRVDGALEAP